METILDAFDSTPAREGTALHLSLNSPAILPLQLADVNVRRQVLLQYAMMLNHLGWVAANSRAPVDEKSPPKMKPGEVERGEFCRSLFQKGGDGSVLRSRVIAMIERTCGFQFKRFTQRMLHRDRRWAHWKKTSCFSKLLAKPHTPSAEYKKRKREPLRVSEEDSNNEDYLERILSMDKEIEFENLEPRKRMKVEDIIAAVREDKEDPDVDEDSKRANDSRFKWQSIRTLIAEGVQYLPKVNRTGVVYMEGILEDEPPAEKAGDDGQNGIDHDEPQDNNDEGTSVKNETENNNDGSEKDGSDMQHSKEDLKKENEEIATEDADTGDKMDMENGIDSGDREREREDSKKTPEKDTGDKKDASGGEDSAGEKQEDVKKEVKTEIMELEKS